METTLSNRKIRSKPKQTQGRGTTGKRKQKQPASGNVADGFLRQRFSPISSDPNLLDDWQKKQSVFFSSLVFIEEKFGISVDRFATSPYPLNIHQSFQQAKEKLEERNVLETLYMVDNGKSPFCLATARPWDTGHTLYYIPLANLLRVLSDRKKRKQAGLLLSACCYLFQVAKLPSYTCGDFISGVYDSLKEWVREDEEMEAYHHKSMSEINMALHFGKKLKKTLCHPYHLAQWEKRLFDFKVQCSLDGEIYSCSERFFGQFKQFPKRRFFEQFFAGQQADEDSIMRADQYLSFVWSNDGWLGEQAFQYVNDCVANYDRIEEPMQFVIYDSSEGRAADNLKFETTFFELLGELTYLLDQF